MSNLATVTPINQHGQIVKAELENGYTRFAHDILDTIISNEAKLTGVEVRVLLAIARKTYSYHKKSDWITNTQIMEKANLSKGHASNILKSLKKKNVLFQEGKKIGINTTVSEWGVHNLVNYQSSQPSEPEFTAQCTTVHSTVNNSSQPSEPQKKQDTTTKETIQKKGDFSQSEKATKKPKAKSKIPHLELPDYVSRELFESYLEVRVQKKYIMSDQAMKILITKIEDLHTQGQNINGLIESAILGAWKSIYPQDRPTKQFAKGDLMEGVL